MKRVGRGVGDGRSRIQQRGVIFEQAGVNFSPIHEKQIPTSATGTRPPLAKYQFEALGPSWVIHPETPYIPTAHANIRFFIAVKVDSDPPMVVWGRL